MPHNIIFIAPPAAGKGTLSNLVKDKHQMAHIAMGDIFRAKTKENNEEALFIKNELAQGHLISDELTIKILEERLKEDDTINGYILDGFPRTIRQALELEKMVQHLDQAQAIVIYLEIDKDEALRRSLGRILCSQCGAIYNKYNEQMKPKKEGICDKCGAQLKERADDNEEAFNYRFDTYLKETKPLLDFYKEKGRLHTIKVGNDPYQLLNEVDQIIKEVAND